MVVLAAITRRASAGRSRRSRGSSASTGRGPTRCWPALSIAVFAIGVGGGYLVYGRNVLDRDRLRARHFHLYGVLEERFYFDWTYDGLIVKPFFVVAEWLSVFDRRRIDGAVNGAASGWSRLSDVLWRRSTSRIIDGAVNGLGRLREVVRRARPQAPGRPRAVLPAPRVRGPVRNPRGDRARGVARQRVPADAERGVSLRCPIS